MTDHQVSEDSDGVWMCGPECPFDDMNECPKWEACHKYFISSDPYCLPVHLVPEGWTIENIYQDMKQPEETRWSCEIYRNELPHTFIERQAPNPRAAMLAAIDGIGK